MNQSNPFDLRVLERASLSFPVLGLLYFVDDLLRSLKEESVLVS